MCKCNQLDSSEYEPMNCLGLYFCMVKWILSQFDRFGYEKEASCNDLLICVKLTINLTATTVDSRWQLIWQTKPMSVHLTGGRGVNSAVTSDRFLTLCDCFIGQMTTPLEEELLGTPICILQLTIIGLQLGNSLNNDWHRVYCKIHFRMLTSWTAMHCGYGLARGKFHWFYI